MGVTESQYPERADRAEPAARSLSRAFLIMAMVPVVVFLLPLALYLKTLCPTIYPGDGPELTAAAWVLGVPHPTGYPLFMVLGWAFQHAGLGSAAFSLNLLCAIFGALACVGAYLLILEVWRVLVRLKGEGGVSYYLLAGSGALVLG
ncbi:DUF2723 domain-containing protein, partial [bacterium]|nr:DUF2723 domain-containing protein [bacterium]